MDFEKYLNIKYRLPCDYGDGLHCYQLVEMVMIEQFGITPPHISYDGNLKDSKPIFFSQSKNWPEVHKDDIQAGDVPLFSIGRFCHCGIMIDKQRMLHVLQGRESTIEKINSFRWRNRLLGVYRWQI